MFISNTTMNSVQFEYTRKYNDKLKLTSLLPFVTTQCSHTLFYDEPGKIGRYSICSGEIAL